MIQQRRHSRKVNGSAKHNKTFDKHNGIKRIKDEDENLDLKAIALDPLIVNLDNLSDEQIDQLSEETGVYI